MNSSDEGLKTCKENLQKIIGASSQKDGIIERFLTNRCHFAIPDEERDVAFWKLLCYEIMYLWNLLGSCSAATLNTIIEDCEALNDLPDSILGLSQFLMGSAYTFLGDHEKAIDSYKTCIEICNENPSKLHLLHIPAYANYELAVLTAKSKSEDSTAEAQKLLQNALMYKSFDFEHRLKLKIHSFKIG